MNFMSMQSMLVKAHPIKGPILRSVLIFMGILSPSILIVHEFDLVSKSAFYQLGSWTILKQMSWYLYIDVELQLAYNVINWSDAIKSKWIERLAIFFAVKENLHCSQYSANLFRLDFVEVVDIATVDPTIKSGPSIESLKKEAKPILNSYFYNLTSSMYPFYYWKLFYNKIQLKCLKVEEITFVFWKVKKRWLGLFETFNT